MKPSATVDIHLHPKQTYAFQSAANEILYGGAAGGGKSHLMRVIAISMCLNVKGLQVYLFRRLSDDLLRSHMEGDGGFYSLLAPLFVSGDVTFNAQKNFIRFRNGSKIWLCHFQHEKDKTKYLGCEIHVLLIDELTTFTEKQYRFLRSRLRTGTLKIPDQYRGKLPLAFSGTNPGSTGHNWVKATFVTSAPPYRITQQPKEEGGMLRQFIPALLQDNPSLDPLEYSGKLSGLGSPELVKAMLEGDWDIVAGGALDDVWSKSTHMLPRFGIPANWLLKRGLDWGSSTPFSVGWWAKANGEEVVMPDGSIFCPYPGSLIRFNEWYGTKKIGSNEGVKMTARAIAEGIKEREDSLRRGYWIRGQVNPGPADNQIFNVVESKSGSIAKLMYEAAQVAWTRSDKSAGTRALRLQYVRDYLTNSINQEGPGLYFMEHCLSIPGTFPVLPRDPDDSECADSKSENHSYDETGYVLLDDIAPVAGNIPIIFPT